MAVPTSGAWQTDPQVQAFIRALQMEGPRTPRGKGDAASPTMQAFNRYIDQNRARLGIPDGYGPNVLDGGKTLSDWSTHPYRQALILGSAAAGPIIAGLTAAQAANTSSIIPGTGIPTVSGAGGAAALPVAPAATSAATSAAGAAGAGAATSAIDKIRKSLTDPTTYASLVPLLTSLAMNSGSGSGSGSEELDRIRAITEARMRRVDPLHQVATQLAFQRAPISAKQGINLSNVTLPG